MRDLSDPLGGDWGSGERVFGPPNGTVETDWFVPLVREAHPGAAHERVRASVARVWAVLREEAERTGAPVAEVDEAAVRRLLGLPGTAGEVMSAPRNADAGGGGTGVESSPGAGGPNGADDALLLTALRVVRAAARAYGG